MLKPIKLFLANDPILHTVKIPENLRVFWRFQGYIKGNTGERWVHWYATQVLDRILDDSIVRGSRPEMFGKRFLKYIANLQGNTIAEVRYQ